MSLPDISTIRLPHRPDLLNCRLIDNNCMPLLSEMERVGTAIDIDHFKWLSEMMYGRMVELEGQIKKRIPTDKLREFLNRKGKGDVSGEDVESTTDSANIEDANDDQLDGDILAAFNVNSAEKVAWLLFDLLGLGKGEVLKTTADGKRISTGKKQLERLKEEHDVIGELLEYRELAKLKSTYVDKLPKIAVKHDKGTCWCGMKHLTATNRVHSTFVTTRTETGRLASRNCNLTNIPARSDLGRLTREGFIASPGMSWVSVDKSQIELRALANCANEKNMTQIYLNGGDIHVETARAAFKLGPDDKVDKYLHRAPAKCVNFGIAFRMTAIGLLAQLILMFHQDNKPVPSWLTEEWCEQFIQTWFSLYPQVKDYMDWLTKMVHRYGIVWNDFGRVRQIHGIWSCHRHIVSECERQAGNMPIQGWAAEIMKIWMMLVLAADGTGMINDWREHGLVYPLLTVHDELNLECEPYMAEMIKSDLMMAEEYIGVEFGFKCPLKAEGDVYDRWKK